MSDTRIVWERPDGGISVTTAAPESRRNGESEADWLERISAITREKIGSHGGLLENVRRLPNCSRAELPSKHFRNCWRSGTSGEVVVDMVLARVQRMAEIRAERDRRLAESDKEWLRILDVSTSEQQNLFKAYRQALRDMPQGIDLGLVDDPEALEVFQPAWPTRPGEL